MGDTFATFHYWLDNRNPWNGFRKQSLHNWVVYPFLKLTATAVKMDGFQYNPASFWGQFGPIFWGFPLALSFRECISSPICTWTLPNLRVHLLHRGTTPPTDVPATDSIMPVRRLVPNLSEDSICLGFSSLNGDMISPLPPQKKVENILENGGTQGEMITQIHVCNETQRCCFLF